MQENPSFKQENMEERKSIRVSELTDICPRKLQFEYLNYQTDPEKYETVLGRLKHYLFETYLKINPDAYQSYYMTKVHPIVQVLLPRDAPKFAIDIQETEKKIKTFMKSDEGTRLRNNPILHIEKDLTVRIPCELLPEYKIPINKPIETLKQYCLSGRPDFKVNKEIFEIKSRESLKKEEGLQAVAYKLMFDIIEPEVKHVNKYILLGGKTIRVSRKPFLTWFLKDARKELGKKIEEMIDVYERVETSEELLERNISSDKCQFCEYHSVCNSIYRPRRNWRVIKVKR